MKHSHSRRGIAALLAAGLALCAPAYATELRIPALPAARATVQLVTSADQRPVLGFDGPEWATAYEALPLDAAQTVELTPTADIATAGGGATCYLVTIAASGGRGGRYCVQVPDSATVQELSALVGATAIDPADITAGRLIPPGGTDGQVLAKSANTDYATEWVTGGGAEDETDPVFSASAAAGIVAQDITDWDAASSASHAAVSVADSTSIDLTLTGQQVSAAAIFGTASGTIAQGNHTHLAENIAPASMVVEYGTLDSGTVADLGAADQTVVAISEVTGTPALQVVLTYTGVTIFNEVRAYLRYSGSATHYLALEVYDYVGADWEQYGTIATSAESAWYFWPIADPAHHVSGGQAQVRIRHIQSGVSSHDLYLDLVGLSSTVEGGALAHPDLTGRSVADAHPASAITNTPAGNIAATTVQAALNELDTDKLATGADAADLTSGAATDGHALLADGAGGAAWEAIPTGGMTDLVQDTTPQLGGALDTQAFSIGGSGKIGAGIASPLAWLHAQGTTEQLRLSYDATNYFRITVAANGAATFLSNYGQTVMPSGVRISNSGWLNWLSSGGTNYTMAALIGTDVFQLGNAALPWTEIRSGNGLTLSANPAEIRPSIGNVLHQVNGTLAQNFRVFNTRTDASNYERASLGWASNALNLGTEAAGTGTKRAIKVDANAIELEPGTGRVTVSDDSLVLATAKTPSSASDTCTAGQIAWDTSYLYVCTSTNAWERAALASW